MGAEKEPHATRTLYPPLPPCGDGCGALATQKKSLYSRLFCRATDRHDGRSGSGISRDRAAEAAVGAAAEVVGAAEAAAPRPAEVAEAPQAEAEAAEVAAHSAGPSG